MSEFIDRRLSLHPTYGEQKNVNRVERKRVLRRLWRMSRVTTWRVVRGAKREPGAVRPVAGGREITRSYIALASNHRESLIVPLYFCGLGEIPNFIVSHPSQLQPG
jgi:hypothetical protein